MGSSRAELRAALLGQGGHESSRARQGVQSQCVLMLMLMLMLLLAV
jgi:hypothetical protein